MSLCCYTLHFLQKVHFILHFLWVCFDGDTKCCAHTGQFIGWEERLIWFWCILHAIKQYKNSIHTKYIHLLVRLSHCLSMWISFSILPPKISVLIKIYMLNELVLFTPWPWHFIMRLTNQMNFYELVDKPVDCLNVLLVFLFKFVGWKI